jgi:Putative polyhydroxyalkanoic acid system protein (PHA_gran_rgn)
MKVCVDHNLPLGTALSKIRNLEANLPNTYKNNIQDLKVIWVDRAGQISFKAAGMAFGGAVEVKDKQILIDFRLPLGLVLLRKRIEKEIITRISEILQSP